MTLSNARRILGKEARELSDDEIQEHIETAEMLKEIFFSSYISKRINEPKMTMYNKSIVP